MKKRWLCRLPQVYFIGKHLLYGLVSLLFLCGFLPGAYGLEAETEPTPPGKAENGATALDPQHWEEDGVREEYADGFTRLVFHEILGDGKIRYRLLPEPLRFYVDIPFPQRTLSWNKLPLKGNAFRQVRIGRYPDKLRLTFDVRDRDLPEPVVLAEGGDLVILASTPGASPGTTLPMGGPEGPPPNTSLPAGSVSVAKADWKPQPVTGIDFQQTDNSSDVIVETKGTAPYDVTEVDKKIVLVIPGAEIPSHLQRHLDTSGFPTAILSIVPEQLGSGPSGRATVTIVLREKRSFDVLREGQTLRVRVQLPEQPPEIKSLPPLKVPESVTLEKEKAEKPTVALSPPPETKEEVTAVAAVPEKKPELPPQEDLKAEKKAEKAKKETVKKPAAPPPAPARPATLRKPPRKARAMPGPEKYKGRKISLDFKDADIQNVLRLIAEVSGKNIVISDAVQGKVTIRLLNVPWDQALDVVLKTYALDKEELAPDILRVAPYTQLKTERDEALRAAKALEQIESLLTKVVPVNYAKADQLRGLLEKIKSTRPDAGILVDVRTNSLVLKDLPQNIDQMTRLVLELDKQTPQVLIEAKIVELDVNFERELGIQWGTLYKAGPATGNPTGLDFPHTANVGGAVQNITGIPAVGVANPVVNLPAAIDHSQGGAIGFSLASITNSFRLDAQLSALEKNKHAKILSSPRVATLNNQEAKIEQGQEVPYQTTSDEGTKTEFKDAMLRLFVTPQINFDRSIIMKIIVSNDTPIKDPTVGFIIQKKEAVTTVLVNDGDTAVIGGIYTNTDQKTSGGVPLFKDIPGLGNLFKKKGTTKDRTELIIFITPRIIPTRKIPVEEWLQ